jgi:hypothetical protein
MNLSSNIAIMEKTAVKTWVFTSLLITMPGMFETQSPTNLSASVTTMAQTELSTSELINISKRNTKRKIKVRSRRIEHNDAVLAQLLNETIESQSQTIRTENIDLRSLLRATSGHTIKPMEKWL